MKGFRSWRACDVHGWTCREIMDAQEQSRTTSGIDTAQKAFAVFAESLSIQSEE
jgi:hypothetical protein